MILLATGPKVVRFHGSLATLLSLPTGPLCPERFQIRLALLGLGIVLKIVPT